MSGLKDITVANYTTFRVGGSADNKWVTIKNISSIGEISGDANLIDVQTYGSKFTRKLVGSSSTGAFDVVINYISQDDSLKTIDELYNTGKRTEFQIGLLEPGTKKHATTNTDDITYITFSGFVASRSFSSDFDNSRQVTYSIAIDGDISGLATATTKAGDDDDTKDIEWGGAVS